MALNELTIQIPLDIVVHHLTILARFCLAAAAGLVIGRERKKNHKPGGARTFGIICLGSCSIAVLTLEVAGMGQDVFNFSRLMSYGLASIGFIGSGVIIQNRDKVEGITTAASLWLMVIIGYLLGLGFYFGALLSFGFTFMILESKEFGDIV